jgi:iron complex outermembrane receptor protein
VYVQDQLTVTPRLGLLLGVRYEMFNDERDYGNGSTTIPQRQLLPRAGLTYALRDNINYFASYSAGFRPLKPEYIRFPERYGRSTAFRPETSYQVETGLKGEFFRKALLGTVAVYQIEKRNQLVATGALMPDGGPEYRQNGVARSRGAELEMTGNVLPTLSLNASYAFNATEVRRADVAAENGQPLANAPQHSAGLWTKYTFTAPAVRGLGVAVGGNYVARRRMENRVPDAQGELYWAYWPSYTVLDAALFYTVNRFNFHLNANNLLDRHYFVGGYDFFRVSPGAPRNYMATLSYTF